jgi:DNA-binding LytR/AlgR family response regulator
MSKSIDIFVVEDEIVIAHDIKGALEDIGYKVLGIARDYQSAIKVFDYEKPDLVLLDITIKGTKTGIDIAEYIRANFNIPFIFITSHANSATIEKAKKTKPNGYLVKPFNQDDLYAAIEVALFNYNDRATVVKLKSEEEQRPTFKDSIFVKSGSLFQRVRIEEITYLEADGVYTNIYTKDKKYADRKILLDFEKVLDPSMFLRVHRSYVVNLAHVTGIKTDQVIVGKSVVPLGRTHKERLLSLL